MYQNLETTQCPSAGEWIKKCDTSTQLNTTQQQKKELITDTCDNMDESQNNYAEWKNSDKIKEYKKKEYTQRTAFI